MHYDCLVFYFYSFYDYMIREHFIIDLLCLKQIKKTLGSYFFSFLLSKKKCIPTLYIITKITRQIYTLIAVWFNGMLFLKLDVNELT